VNIVVSVVQAYETEEAGFTLPYVQDSGEDKPKYFILSHQFFEYEPIANITNTTNVTNYSIVYNYTLSYVKTHPPDYEMFISMISSDMTFMILVFMSVGTMVIFIVGIFIYCCVRACQGYDTYSKIAVKDTIEVEDKVTIVPKLDLSKP